MTTDRQISKFKKMVKTSLGIDIGKKSDMRAVFAEVEKRAQENRESFPLKDGDDPFELDSVFLKGFFFFAFSNEYGEEWAAYIDLNNLPRIWFSGCDIDWEWQGTFFNEHGELEFLPISMNDNEKRFINAIHDTAVELKQKRIQTET